MAIEIIRADSSHAAAIATIGKKSFRRAFENIFRSKEELFEYVEHTYDPVKLAKSLRKENNVYYLAFDGGEAVGFAKVKKVSLNEHIESIAQMELQKIYVLPEYQQMGVGSALLRHVLSMAKEIFPDFLWLDATISNERAIRFYERNGFQRIGKQYFTIGTQTFEYFVMGLPVAVAQGTPAR
jgi:ribosomal protein S18 acetylase RimI-like enzyme